MNDIQRDIIATAVGFQPTEAGLYEVRHSLSQLPEDGVVSAAIGLAHPLADGKMIVVCCADPDPIAVSLCVINYIDKYTDDDGRKAELASHFKDYVYRMVVIGHDAVLDGRICSNAGLVIVDGIGCVPPAQQAVLMDALLKWSEGSGVPVIVVRGDIASDAVGCACRKIDRGFVDGLLETTRPERERERSEVADVIATCLACLTACQEAPDPSKLSELEERLHVVNGYALMEGKTPDGVTNRIVIHTSVYNGTVTLGMMHTDGLNFTALSEKEKIKLADVCIEVGLDVPRSRAVNRSTIRCPEECLAEVACLMMTRVFRFEEFDFVKP